MIISMAHNTCSLNFIWAKRADIFTGLNSVALQDHEPDGETFDHEGPWRALIINGAQNSLEQVARHCFIYFLTRKILGPPWDPGPNWPVRESGPKHGLTDSQFLSLLLLSLVTIGLANSIQMLKSGHTAIYPHVSKLTISGIGCSNLME